MSLCYGDFIFFRYTPWSRITTSCGRFIFWFLRNHHNILHSGYTNLCFNQQCMRVPFSLHLPQPSLIFFIIAILTRIQWYLIVVLIYISLVANHNKHFSYMYCSCVFFWEVSIQIIYPVLIGLLFFWLLSSLRALYIMYINPKLDK
jgi:hypothetical protein